MRSVHFTVVHPPWAAKFVVELFALKYLITYYYQAKFKYSGTEIPIIKKQEKNNSKEFYSVEIDC